MSKNKRRSCALCKPHKRGWAPRDTDRHRMAKREAANEISKSLGRAAVLTIDDPAEQLNAAAALSRIAR